jgi:hypothetical protein
VARLKVNKHTADRSAEGLAGGFGPLRSLDDPALRHNLLWQATSFVGQTAELAELQSLAPGFTPQAADPTRCIAGGYPPVSGGGALYARARAVRHGRPSLTIAGRRCLLIRCAGSRG